MADESTIPPSVGDTMRPISLSGKPKCLFCGVSGRVVTGFPRRGYGSTLFSRSGTPKTGEDFWGLEKNQNEWRNNDFQKDIRSLSYSGES